MTIFSNTSPGATFGTVPAPNPFWNGSFDSKRQVSDSLKLINHLEEIFVFCFFLASSFSKFLAFFTALHSISCISAGAYHRWDSMMKAPGARPSALHLCFMLELQVRGSAGASCPYICKTFKPRASFGLLSSCACLQYNGMSTKWKYIGPTQSKVKPGTPMATCKKKFPRRGTILYYPSTNVYFPCDCILVYILLYKGTVFDETLYTNAYLGRIL